MKRKPEKRIEHDGPRDPIPTIWGNIGITGNVVKATRETGDIQPAWFMKRAGDGAVMTVWGAFAAGREGKEMQSSLKLPRRTATGEVFPTIWGLIGMEGRSARIHHRKRAQSHSSILFADTIWGMMPLCIDILRIWYKDNSGLCVRDAP